MDIDEILSKALTPDQLAAVKDNSRNILCLACAGSGKSRTLAYKIACLIANGENPESIIAFTFTEKAADSIKRRVAEALKSFGLPENNIGAMFIGTLDSFCQKLLGDIDAKYRQYEILDMNGLILFIMSRYNKLGLHKIQGKYFKDKIQPLADAWQTMNNENIELDNIQRYDEDTYQSLAKLKQELDRDGYMDFSFAIKLGVEELKKITDKENSYIAKFNYLFVDEYQDINPIQEEFIKTLASHLKMLFVVGDDDQSIYGWRGANVENILTFKERYQNVSVHRLLVNFRSTQSIVEGANKFVQLELNTKRLSKDIKFNSDGNIQDTRKLWFDEHQDEAEWIASRIEKLIGTKYVEGTNPDGTEKARGLTYSDFAILLRSIHNSRGENRDKVFTDALKAHNIPFRTTGEGGIFDRPYAACIRAAMELLREPGISRETASEFFDVKVTPHFPYAEKEKFINVIHKWHHNIHGSQAVVRRKVYPQEFLHDLIDAFNVRSFEDETALRDLGLYSKIILDVEKTYTSIDSSYRFSEMLNFINTIAEGSYELEQSDILVKENAVNISTIHKVKGLEFPVVFVVDLIGSRFPHKNEQYNGKIPQELMGAAMRRGAYGTRRDDEARLFYTAITRAERCLYLSGSTYHEGLKKACKRSEFMVNFVAPNLREDILNDDLAEKITPSPRFDENDFPTDYTSIKKYLSCPFAYKLGTIYGYNAAVPELFGFGKTTHTILERLHQRFKKQAPTPQDVLDIIESTFMLKHVFKSKDPENHPGSYERAKNLVQRVMTEYVAQYGADFSRLRQDEARFEIPAEGALITGAIDLLMKEDPATGITTADVIDFKSMETPEDIKNYDWRDMSVQVQLYSKAAREIIGDNVQTGYIHTLKDNRRTSIPVDEQSVDNAIKSIEWAVKGILHGDFPMRACKHKCENCDFKAMCAQKRQEFKMTDKPPQINTPNGPKDIAAFDEDGNGEVAP